MNRSLCLSKLLNKISQVWFITARILTSVGFFLAVMRKREEEEEMLISEEEIPFKDDPRDETYKPHLERHVSGLLVKMLELLCFSFHLVAKLGIWT